jgi:hypothetical protein
MSSVALSPVRSKRPYMMRKGIALHSDLRDGDFAVSKDFNIDNGSGTTDDDIILVPNRAVTILSARIVYVEATDTAGVTTGTVSIGTTVGGVDIVAATAFEISKAVGSVTDLTIVDGAVAAGEMIAVRHTGIAATEAGAYFVQIEYA